MDLSAWGKGLTSSASYVSLEADSLLPEAETSEAKNQRDPERKLPSYFPCNVCDAAGSFIHSGYPEMSPDSRHHLPYTARNFNVGQCAKRARVENIIKGMTAAPAGHRREATTSGSAADLKLNCSIDTQQTDTNLGRSKPQKIKLVAEVLKYELSRAVSRSVDSIFRSLPPPDHDDGRSSSWLSACGSNVVPNAQALSLVVRKADQFSRSNSTPRSGSSLENFNEVPQNIEKSVDVSLPKPELSDDGWKSVRVRSKVNSRLARSLAVVEPPLRSLCLPLVKMESEELVQNSLNVGDVSFSVCALH